MILGAMSMLPTAIGSWKSHLQAFRSAGGNVYRLFWCYFDGGRPNENRFGPFLKLGDWNPYALCGASGRPNVPQYDTTQKDPESWATMKEILAEMARLGIAPWIAFRDRCSESDNDYERYYKPFYGCLKNWPYWKTIEANGKNYYTNQGTLDEAIAGGSIGSGMDEDHYRLYDWTMTLCRELKIPTVYGEPMNEVGWDEAPGCTVEDQVRYVKAQCKSLRDLGYVVVVSATRALNVQVLTAGKVDFDLWDQHCISEVEDIAGYPNGLPPARVIWDTDGGLSHGDGPGKSVYGVKDSSPEQFEALAREAIRVGAAGIKFMSQGQITTDTPGNWDLTQFDLRAVEAAGKVLFPAPDYVDVEVCTTSHLLPSPYCPVRAVERFLKGSEPTQVCQVHAAPPIIKVKVCQSSGLLPNEYCTQVEREFVQGSEPVAVCTACKPCSYFLAHLNIWDWLRCVIFGKH